MINTPTRLNTTENIPDNPMSLGTIQPSILKGIASFFSYLFHPVFIPLLAFGFMLYVHPYLFIGLSDKNKILILVRAIVLFTFFPLITVLLLKGVGFISSIKLATRKDRIIPLVASGIWYFWAWNVWRHLDEYPHEAIVFAMAVFFSSSIGLLLNIYMKISLHAIAVGVLLAFFMWMAFRQNLNYSLYLSVVLLISGIVCTSRFVVSNHTQKEVYIGFFAGMAALLLAVYFA